MSSKKRISFQETMGDDESETDEKDKKAPPRFSFIEGLRKMSQVSGQFMKSVSNTIAAEEAGEVDEAEFVRPIPVKKDDSDTDSWASPREESIKGPFRVPDDWPISAELAIKMLEDERSNLKASESVVERMRQNMLATNRFLAGNLRKVLGEDEKAFRGGIEPIAHVLPADTQSELHARVCSAAKLGEKEILLSLLRFAVDLDRSDMFGTPLHYAAAAGQLQSIQILLDKGGYPGAVNFRDETPLHLASTTNSPICVEILIQYGAPVNASDCGGRTAMHIAAENGYIKVVEKLILGGADCNRHTKLGLTPLHLASVAMHHLVVEMLCRDGNADANLGSLRAARIGDPGDPNKPFIETVKGDTAAHLAAKKGFALCLKACLDHGAKPETVNDDGATVMHSAVDAASLRIVELIFNYGWDFLVMEDKNKRDPIDYCTYCMQQLAEDNGLDLQSRDTLKEELNQIKSRLSKMLIRRNHENHLLLIEQTKKGIAGKKRVAAADAAVVEGEDEELDNVEPDEQTLKEKLASMALELEATKGEARSIEQQSKMKTIRLNETLIELKRKLAEVEYVLAREKESRRALEQDILNTMGIGIEVGNTSQNYQEDAAIQQTPDVLRISTAAYSASRARPTT